MKNFNLLFAFFLFSVSTTFSQSTQFFPTQDGVWEEYFIGISGTPQFYYHALCGDTLIGGEEYSKMYNFILDTDGNIANRIYVGASRRGADEVWFIHANTTDEIILYDFSLEVGDTFDSGALTLSVVDNQLLNTNDGITRRVIFFEPQASGISGEYWIEGIGSTRGLLTRGMPVTPDFDPGMRCFHFENDEVWNFGAQPCNFPTGNICEGTTALAGVDFSKKINISFYPHPFSEQTSVEIEGFENLEEPFVRVFNLQGKLIQKIEHLTEEKFIFFRKHLKAGLYVFELRDRKTTFAVRKKIVVF